MVIHSYAELQELLAVDEDASNILKHVSHNGMSDVLITLINELLNIGQLNINGVVQFVNNRLQYVWGYELVHENIEEID